MMSCGKIQRTIQAYVDGTATGAERAAVDRHVAHCARCARCLAESRQLLSLLASVPAREVSDDFERNLARALRHTAPVSRGAAWWERFRFRYEWRFRGPALLTAGSLAAGVLAAVVAPPYLERQQQQQQAQLRERLLASTVERHEQLERANPHPDWEAMDASIDLTTGSVLTE